MRKAYLKKMQRHLQTKEAELVKALRGREELSIQTGGDELEYVRSAAEREIAISNLDRESELLQDVRSALGRITDETFGTCLRCGDEIPERRLAAVPWTPHCLSCQEAAERMDPETDLLSGPSHERAA